MRTFLMTDRLVLRRFTNDDVDKVVELNGDPEVMRYLTGGKPTPREVVRDEIIPRWLAYYEQYEGYGFWAAIEKATGEFLGWFHFRPHHDGPRSDGTARDGIELGYRLRRSAWGRGYATEGCRALIRKGYTPMPNTTPQARRGAPRAAVRRMRAVSNPGVRVSSPTIKAKDARAPIVVTIEQGSTRPAANRCIT